MLLLDVNPLVYGLRADVPEHRSWRKWLESLLDGDEPFGLSNATLAAVVRVATSARVFKTPTPLKDVFEFIDVVRDAPGFVTAEPGPRHWSLFEGLCRATGTVGGKVSDVYLAALAVELDAELITADHDFTRFPKLRVRNPVGGG